MQAVADNFPILLTTLLLSLALCGWGLSNYAIASRKQEQEDKGKPRSARADSVATGNQQFATPQAVNNQTLSRNRTINRGGRISAELKSVAALQTQNRQRQSAEHQIASARSTKRIGAAGLDLDSAPELVDTADTVTRMTNIGSSGINRDLQNDALQNNDLQNNALQNNNAQGADDSKKNSKAEELSVQATLTGEKLKAENDIAKEPLPSAATGASGKPVTGAKSPATQVGSTDSRQANDRANDQANDQANDMAHRIEQTARDTGHEYSERNVETTTLSSSTMHQAERIHHAATADKSKITAVSKNVGAEGKRSKHKSGNTISSADAPKVAAYQMPANPPGSSRSPDPLTEVKATDNTASFAADDSSVSTATKQTTNTDSSSTSGSKSSGPDRPSTSNNIGAVDALASLDAQPAGLTTRLDPTTSDPETADKNTGIIGAHTGQKVSHVSSGSTHSNSSRSEQHTPNGKADAANTTAHNTAVHNTAAHNTAAHKDTTGTEKYQTAAKLKQMSPSHEAQLQLKTSDVAALQSSGSANRLDTDKHNDPASLNTQRDQKFTALAKSTVDTDKAGQSKPAETIGDRTTCDGAVAAPAAFSDAEDLESTLALEAALEAKNQLINELKARVTDLETNHNSITATDQTDTGNYKQQLAETTEALQLSNNKVGKLQSTLQSLQSRAANAQSVPSTPASAITHNRSALSSKVRVLDIQSVS